MIAPADAHEPITAEMRAQLAEAYPNAERVVVAMRLALDVEACAALLRDEPVAPERLSPVGLIWAQERCLVRLDLAALDLLTGREAA